MKKVFIFGGIAIVLIIIITVVIISCRGKNDTTDTGSAALTYWRVNDDEDIFKPLFDSFNEKYPNVKIEYSKKDLSEYYNQLLDALAGDTGPDIFSIRNDWLPAFKDKIDIIPEDIYTKDQFQEAFVDVATKNLVDNNGIYGIPLAVDTIALIYNNRMLADARCVVPPKNWNDFIDCSKKITRLKGSRVIRSGTALGTANNLDATPESSKKLATDIISAMTIQSGGEMVSADNSSASFGLPVQKASGGNVYPGTSALDFFTSFARLNKETYCWHSRMPNAIKSFANQETGMLLGYSDIVKAIENQNPSITIFSSPLPQIKGSDDQKTIATYWIEVVAKESKHRKEAWKLLQFLSNDNGIAKYSAATSKPPSRKSMVEGASAATRYGAFAAQLTYAVTWYQGKQPAKVYDIFANMINGVLSGQKPQSAIDTARNAVTALLQTQKQGSSS
jgi:multiple sugar transport system substrate-binding protein